MSSCVHVIHVCCSSPEPVQELSFGWPIRKTRCATGHSSSLLLCPVCLAPFSIKAKVEFPASTRVRRVQLPSGQEIQNPLDLRDRECSVVWTGDPEFPRSGGSRLRGCWSQGTCVPLQLRSARYSLVCHDCLNDHFVLGVLSTFLTTTFLLTDHSML